VRGGLIIQLSTAALACAWSLAASSLASAGAGAAVEVISQSLPPQVTGAQPDRLILSRDGNFYGCTSSGGDYNFGTFFRMTPAGEVTQLSSFGGNNGARPSQTELVEGVDGNFYGAVYSSGPHGPFPPHANGAIIRITRRGESTFFADFTGSGASGPVSLTAARDGNLYGVTADGTSTRGGAIFRASPQGKITVLGRLPVNYVSGDLVEGADGNLYGSFIAPASGPDYIFKVTPAGDISVFHTFGSAGEGFRPSRIIAAPDGHLYGKTSAGGPNNNGTIYRLSLSGTLTVLNDRGFDLSRLVLASDGNFYAVGLLQRGRPLPPDTLLYRVTTDGAVTLLHTLPGLASSVSAVSGGPAADLYGAFSQLTPSHDGTIFRLTAAGEYSALYTFSPRSKEYPTSALIEAPDGNLYATTGEGGEQDAGTVFRVTPGGDRQVMSSFVFIDGGRPEAALTLGLDGLLYGTTTSGGSSGQGMIFRMTLNGARETLATFGPQDGQRARGPLLQAKDGAFYGTTYTGGAANRGTVFRFSPSGELHTLASFAGENGSYPTAGLVEASNGSFYGMTNGTSFSPLSPAAVFEAKQDGQLLAAHRFANPSVAAARLSELVQAPQGIYGIAPPNPAERDLTIFRFTPGGALSEIGRIEERELRLPSPGLTLASDGNFYAALPFDHTARGYGGRIVRVTPDGIISTIAALDASHGTPNTRLVQTGDGAFYGTTVFGLDRGLGGTIYRARLLAPRISRISPAAPVPGDEIVISGEGLSGVTAVNVGGQPASFSIDSATKITAKVPAGAAGNATSVTASTGMAIFPSGSVPPARALNISTRALVGTGDDAMIGGIIISGGGPKKVMVRAVGPSLTAAGVAGALADPTLQVYNAAGELVGANDDWVHSEQSQAISETGIAPTDGRESAVIANLQAGNYTAVLRGAGDTSGVALVELYDLAPAAGQLANIATRAQVHSHEGVMIGGFILAGHAPSKILVRAVGPSLRGGASAVAGALRDPVLELRDSAGNLMAANDDWQKGAQSDSISATGIAPPDAAESAIIATLEPGSYTAIVRGAKASSGVALVEVYNLN
jgi:uncharacterized repeat protein (TIGR03803 family)